jgi:hypothetical protein
VREKCAKLEGNSKLGINLKNRGKDNQMINLRVWYYRKLNRQMRYRGIREG